MDLSHEAHEEPATKDTKNTKRCGTRRTACRGDFVTFVIFVARSPKLSENFVAD
jgi:hypothetical protein